MRPTTPERAATSPPRPIPIQAMATQVNLPRSRRRLPHPLRAVRLRPSQLQAQARANKPGEGLLLRRLLCGFFLRCRLLLSRDLGAGFARFRQTDGNSLLAAGDFLLAASALELAFFHGAHFAFDRLRCFGIIFSSAGFFLCRHASFTPKEWEAAAAFQVVPAESADTRKARGLTDGCSGRKDVFDV